jgi:hypothetical protein
MRLPAVSPTALKVLEVEIHTLSYYQYYAYVELE